MPAYPSAAAIMTINPMLIGPASRIGSDRRTSGYWCGPAGWSRCYYGTIRFGHLEDGTPWRDDLAEKIISPADDFTVRPYRARVLRACADLPKITLRWASLASPILTPANYLARSFQAAGMIIPCGDLLKKTGGRFGLPNEFGQVKSYCPNRRPYGLSSRHMYARSLRQPVENCRLAHRLGLGYFCPNTQFARLVSARMYAFHQLLSA